MKVENTYFDMASTSSDSCLIICDGGTMDMRAREFLIVFIVLIVCLLAYSAQNEAAIVLCVHQCTLINMFFLEPFIVAD